MTTNGRRPCPGCHEGEYHAAVAYSRRTPAIHPVACRPDRSFDQVIGTCKAAQSTRLGLKITRETSARNPVSRLQCALILLPSARNATARYWSLASFGASRCPQY